MAFPFRSPVRPPVHTLRQRILVAIGSGGLAALSPFAGFGCGTSAIDDQPSATAGSGHAGVAAGTAGMGSSGTTGGAGTSSVGGSGTGVAGDGVTPIGGAMAAGGVGGAMASGGTGATGVMCMFGGSPTESCYSRTEMESKARYGCGGGLTPEPPPERTPDQIAASFLPSGCVRKEVVCDGCCNPAEAEGLPRGDGSCCYQHCPPNGCCGRPFVVNGAARLAGLVAGSDWLDPTVALDLSQALPPGLGARIAREWLDDARMEHASIASFARFSEELLAFGAPADLVRDARQAVLDEVVHARTCFALAARFGGIAYGPGALDTHDALPAATLREAAQRAFVEGCIGETLAAAHARAACDVAGDPEARRVLARIAADEERHAVLAWRFVAWTLAQGDAAHGLAADVRRVLAEARDAVPAALDDGAGEETASREVLHHAGRLTERDRASVARTALLDVVAPCADAMLASHARTCAPRARSGAWARTTCSSVA